jgi:hypothetical protein
MVEVNGQPKLGSSVTTLGIRLGKDIEIDAQGMVQRPAFQRGKKNGLSCAPTIRQLPRLFLPHEWGGSHSKTKVWRISEADLGQDLIAKQDAPNHVSIGPANAMTFAMFETLVQATASKWVKMEKP